MLSNVATASLIGLACLSSIVSAAPFSFPDNGQKPGVFPNITNPSQQLTNIEKAAHGSLPIAAPSNVTAPPPKADSITSLQLIAFNEIFEVAFFVDLILNITNRVDGYNNFKSEKAREEVLSILTVVQAQEELHALNANGALAKFTGEPIQPCQYQFPVTNFVEAITLASTFTDVVLGTLQNVETIFGTDGDVGLIQGVASVIGQEGEQNGFYRSILGKNPSALPFLTTSTREFAFSALNQDFVVPGSCPNSNIIDLPIFGALNVLTPPQAHRQNVKFSFDAQIEIRPELATPQGFAQKNYNGLSLVYINQQNVPIVKPLQNISIDGNTVTFEADFPFDGVTFGNGLTIAAVTNSAGPFANAAAVAKATLFGPGLIEVN